MRLVHLGQARRVGHDAINDVVRKTLLTYWNTVSFLALYAKASNFQPGSAPALAERSLMDRWIYSDLQQLIIEVDEALTDFDSQRAGKALAGFIDDLSNWYVRRSRRRFWDGDLAALATLHEALRTLTLLLAPMVPFIAEHVWQELIRPVEADAPESVHLAAFPFPDASAINKKPLPRLLRLVASWNLVAPLALNRQSRCVNRCSGRSLLQLVGVSFPQR